MKRTIDDLVYSGKKFVACLGTVVLMGCAAQGVRMSSPQFPPDKKEIALNRMVEISKYICSQEIPAYHPSCKDMIIRESGIVYFERDCENKVTSVEGKLENLACAKESVSVHAFSWDEIKKIKFENIGYIHFYLTNKKKPVRIGLFGSAGQCRNFAEAVNTYLKEREK